MITIDKNIKSPALMQYKDSYLPIDPNFYEVIQQAKEARKSGKIHFFNPMGEVDDGQGLITSIIQNEQGKFVLLSDRRSIRLDKIITLYGRPGPSYEAYDRYANACLACEDLGQFH